MTTAAASPRIEDPKQSRHTIGGVSELRFQVNHYCPTFVPHAKEMQVAAILETILALCRDCSDIVLAVIVGRNWVKMGWMSRLLDHCVLRVPIVERSGITITRAIKGRRRQQQRA